MPTDPRLRALVSQDPDKKYAGTDFYLRQDAKGAGEYACYRSNAAPNDASENERNYWRKQAEMHEASDAGHESMTKRTIDELARRLAERDVRRR